MTVRWLGGGVNGRLLGVVVGFDDLGWPCGIITLRNKGSIRGSKVVLSGEPSKVQQRTEKGSLKNKKGYKT